MTDAITVRGVRFGSGRIGPGYRAVFVLAAYALCLLLKLATCHFDVSTLIVAGDEVVSADRLTYPIAVEPHSPGYDGQYFYRLALDPFDTAPDAHGVSMRNHPEVRAQRIVYPAAAWSLSLGQGRWVPYTLVAVNIIGLVALAGIAARLAGHFGVPPGLGLLVAFYPGFVLSLCRDTAEIAATTFALAALLAAVRNRWGSAAILASVAVLTREATLLYLAGFGLLAAWRTMRDRSLDRSVLWCLCPLATYLVWQLAIKATWGTYSWQVVGHDDFTPAPLASYLAASAGYVATLFAGPFRYSVLYGTATCASFALLLAFLAIRTARRPTPPFALLLPFLLFAAMAVTFSQAVWRDPWGYVRILNDFYVFGVVTLIATRKSSALRAMIPYVGVTWLASVGYAI